MARRVAKAAGGSSGRHPGGAEAKLGFVSVSTRQDCLVGEIGLNAVDPAYVNHGVGTRMYEYALDQMRAAGMTMATVNTGGEAACRLR